MNHLNNLRSLSSNLSSKSHLDHASSHHPLIQPSPTVNDVKKARDLGKDKFASTRDRFQSQPSKNFDTSGKAPPPPPPARSSGSNSNNHERSPSVASRSSFSTPSPTATGPPPAFPRRQSSNAPPPPVRRVGMPRPDTDSTDVSPSASQSNLPASLSRSNSNVTNGNQQTTIDWSNLSHQDKTAFFALLDEYFESRRGNVGVLGGSTFTQEPVGNSNSTPPPVRTSVAYPRAHQLTTHVATTRDLVSS